MERGRSGVPRCGNCGAEIPWEPVTLGERVYCCGGCAQGGPCYCSYDLATHDSLRPGARSPGSTAGSQEPVEGAGLTRKSM